MERAQAFQMMENLKTIFDIVRLVDVPHAQCYFSDGKNLSAPQRCYAIWGKNSRCENCISSEAYACKTKISKFEFTKNDDVYFVLSQYLEIDGTPYALEMVNKIEDKALFAAYNKKEFAASIQHFTSKMFLDPLTGAYNRLYYSEQLEFITKNFSIAMLDIDNFKTINDQFGHLVGDLALIKIVKTFKRLIHGTEAIIRYGGDEFLLVLNKTDKESLFKRLDEMRYEIAKIVFDDYPKLKLTVSIGGISSPNHNSDEAMQAVDDIMYEAKQKRNRVVVD